MASDPRDFRPESTSVVDRRTGAVARLLGPDRQVLHEIRLEPNPVGWVPRPLTDHRHPLPTRLLTPRNEASPYARPLIFHPARPVCKVPTRRSPRDGKPVG